MLLLKPLILQIHTEKNRKPFRFLSGFRSVALEFWNSSRTSNISNENQTEIIEWIITKERVLLSASKSSNGQALSFSLYQPPILQQDLSKISKKNKKNNRNQNVEKKKKKNALGIHRFDWGGCDGGARKWGFGVSGI